MVNDMEALLETELLSDFLNGQDWFVISLLAVLITVSILAMVYAVAYGFNSERLKRMAKVELYQVTATALMIIFLVEFFQLGGVFLSSLFEGGVTTQDGEVISSPLEFAKYQTIYRLEFLNEEFNRIVKADIGPERAYSRSISLMGITIYQGAWSNPQIHRLVESYHTIALKIVDLQVALNMQYFFLRYVGENMLAFFLPTGIILRSFYFTRGLGDLFISIALGLGIVYPTILFINDVTYVSSPSIPSQEQLYAGACDIPTMGGITVGGVPSSSQLSAGAIASQLSATSSITSFISKWFFHVFYNNMVSFSLSIMFIRYATTILGGDAALVSQMLVKVL